MAEAKPPAEVSAETYFLQSTLWGHWLRLACGWPMAAAVRRALNFGNPLPQKMVAGKM